MQTRTKIITSAIVIITVISIAYAFASKNQSRNNPVSTRAEATTTITFLGESYESYDEPLFGTKIGTDYLSYRPVSSDLRNDQRIFLRRDVGSSTRAVADDFVENDKLTIDGKFAVTATSSVDTYYIFAHAANLEKHTGDIFIVRIAPVGTDTVEAIFVKTIPSNSDLETTILMWEKENVRTYSNAIDVLPFNNIFNTK